MSLKDLREKIVEIICQQDDIDWKWLRKQESVHFMPHVGYKCREDYLKMADQILALVKESVSPQEE